MSAVSNKTASECQLIDYFLFYFHSPFCSSCQSFVFPWSCCVCHHVHHIFSSVTHVFLNKDLSSLFQAVGKRHSPTPLQRQGWHMPSRRHAVRATWASVAATGRSRGITTRRKAGSGEAARPTSSTGSSSLAASWMPARLKRPHGAWWTYITTRQGER